MAPSSTWVRNMDIRKSKDALRKEALATRRLLSSAVCDALSARIAENLFETKLFQEAKTILLYADIRNEVRTEAIRQEAVKRGKKTAFPKVLPDGIRFFLTTGPEDFTKGIFGISEPDPARCTALTGKEEDLLIMVPGLLFTKDGARLGYGGGYYDRFLKGAHQAPTVALAYESQLVSSLPEEPFDIRMQYILTERGIYHGHLCERPDQSD